MQTRLTLLMRDGHMQDVELRGPSGATSADIAELLHTSAGAVAASSQSAPLWAGSRALPPSAMVGGPGLRDGSIVGLDQPAPREVSPHAAIRIHVVGGPDAGRVEAVRPGRSVIGRDPTCEIRLSDPDVSRRHAELAVTPSGITVRDLDSTNGTRILSAADGPIAIGRGGHDLALDAYLNMGETTLCVAGVSTPPAVTGISEDGRLHVNRPPRLDAVAPPERLDLAALPGPWRPAAVPWLAALAPALAGVGLAWFMHSPTFLAFALLSPLILVGTSVSERFGGRRGRRLAQTSVQEQHAREQAAITGLLEAEMKFRRRVHPDPAAVLGMAVTPSARVWERRPADDDFLDVRLGLGSRPARLTVHRGSEVQDLPLLAGVPATICIRDGPLGICGPRPLVLPVARWIVGQLAALHSPGDLRIVALLGDYAEDWRWLRWLPHVRADGGRGEPGIARSAEQRQYVVADLCSRIESAQPSGSTGVPRHPNAVVAPPALGQPWTVVLVDRCSGAAEFAGLSRGLYRGAAAGITAVCLDDEPRRLPPACIATAHMSGETGSRIRVRTHDALARRDPGAPPVADRVSAQWCDRVARALAPLSDPGAERARDLPNHVRARDLFALSDLSPVAIRARWNLGVGRACTPLAVSQDGPVEIDLGRDGPHALVAGTTGAGKSELLQTLVAGLAVHASPADLQFVLIDYKGGAAFGECARLPHAVGMVTDLDGHLTARALRSLDAELRRRETLFARVGVADLTSYRATHLATEAAADPLARLVLVVDEFAALADELPDFVTGLVGIAQRGRSLGVHLILATQRPGGVVSPEIRANTGLRIALRVTDPGESSDVIGSELAAHLDERIPGRAFIRTGRALVRVQIARIGVRVADPETQIGVVALNDWGTPLADPRSHPDFRPTDLQVIVAAVRGAAEGHFAPSRRPWLDPLPAWLDLAGGPDAQGDRTVRLGLADRPAEQAQTPFVLDLADPSTVVFVGGPRSGRSSVLRTAAMVAATQLDVDAMHIYAIDCAGGGLIALAGLPHCGAVVGRDAPTSISTLLQRLSRELDRRRLARAEQGLAQSGLDERPGEPALLVLLDGWEGFLATMEELDAGRSVDTFLQLLRDGGSAGFTILITGDRAALAARVSSAVRRRLVLRLADPADYAIAGLSPRQIPSSMPPGRAIDTADGSEVQLGVLGSDPSGEAHVAALRRATQHARRRDRNTPGSRRPFAVRALPSQVRLAELATSVEPGLVRLGLGGDSGDLVSLDLRPRPRAHHEVRFLVTGPARSGRSTLLCVVLSEIVRTGGTVIAAAGPASPLALAASARGAPVLNPDPGGDRTGRAMELLAAGRPATLLIDDSELFADTNAGDWVTALIRRSPPHLNVFVAGRADDVTLAFRGIAAEVKRARTGVVLQPGPGDGEVLGLRLPYHRSNLPPGRGLLVAPDLVTDYRPGTDPIHIQIALP